MLRFIALILLLIAPAIANAQSSLDTPPDRPFTLLLIGQGESLDARSNQIAGMISRPSSKEMNRWAQLASPKYLAFDSPIVQEHHGDILKRANSLPILALVDANNGSTWHVMSGQSLPRDEYDLARQLDVMWGATLQAAQEVGVNPVQTVDRNNFNRQSTVGSRGGPFTPVFKPQIVTPDGFDINTHVDAGEKTRTAGIIVGALVFFSAIVIALGFVFGASILSAAFTRKPNKIQRPT